MFGVVWSSRLITIQFCVTTDLWADTDTCWNTYGVQLHIRPSHLFSKPQYSQQLSTEEPAEWNGVESSVLHYYLTLLKPCAYHGNSLIFSLTRHCLTPLSILRVYWIHFSTCLYAINALYLVNNGTTSSNYLKCNQMIWDNSKDINLPVIEVVPENLWHNSYVMRKEQFVSACTQRATIAPSKRLLMLKHPKKLECPIFYQTK